MAQTEPLPEAAPHAQTPRGAAHADAANKGTVDLGAVDPGAVEDGAADKGTAIGDDPVAARLVRACLSPWGSGPDAPLCRLIAMAMGGLGSPVALRNAFVESLNEQVDRVAPALPPRERRVVGGAQLAVLVNRHILHVGPLADAPFEQVADRVAEQIAAHLS